MFRLPLRVQAQNFCKSGLIAPFLSPSPHNRFIFGYQQPCRHAGGGGRPGGKPAFNWKQRRSLKLDNIGNSKEFKIKPFGSYDEIKPFYDENAGDVTIDLNKVASFDDETLFPPNVEDETGNLFKGDSNTRKILQISNLYGSKKPYGLLERKLDEKKLAKKLTHRRPDGGRRKKKSLLRGPFQA